VLSFLGKIRTRKMMNRMKTIINKLTKSLQVPCSPLFYISKSYLPGKRVLPFISQKRTRKRFEGSITVEAAVVLPLFVFFGLAVLAPMRWLDTQRQIQTTMERLGETLSQQAYSVELADEQENIQLEFQYQEKIPLFFEKIGITMCVGVKRRGWVGLDGKLTRQSVNGEVCDQEMVYVTPRGERYHRYRDCTHLTNVCQAVSISELDHLRNLDGKIYYSCSQCVSGQNIQDTVYITSWGTRYHNDRSCEAISSYFRKVPLEQVIELGECTVCARRSD